MKRERIHTFLAAALISFCVSFGGAGCIITGFSMDNYDRFAAGVTASLPFLAVFCLAFSATAAFWFSGRWKWWMTAGVAATMLAVLWLLGDLGPGIEALAYRLSYTYHRAYGIPVLHWGEENPLRTAPDMGLCLMAAVVSAVTAWTVCRRKGTLPSVAAGLIPLILCIVVTDTVPDNWCLFLLIAGLAILMLTGTVRSRSAREGNRLTALLLVPVVLATSVLFWAVPRESYGAASDEMQQEILSWFQGLPFVQTRPDGTFMLGFSGSSVGGVNLSSVGPKGNAPYAVMDVTAAESGPIYLRGQSLDEYTGKAWSASGFSTGDDIGWAPLSSVVTEIGDVTISTRGGQPLYYFPYYPTGENWENALLASGGFVEGRVNNPKRIRTYSFAQKAMPVGGGAYGELDIQMENQCLQLPESTYTRAKSILGQLSEYQSALSTDAKVRVISDYVENSATYSLATKRMPAHESDFAIWFLKQSDTGYCIHFATAATVLLRAAGIPARYVTGYLAQGTAGQEVTVTADDAHAWVEYFDSRYGWRMLDPTPGSGEEPAPDTRPTVPAQPTETEPSQTTTPDETTRPDDTDPTDPERPVPTTPNGGADQPGTKPEVELDWLWSLLRVLLWICGICAAVLGQYFLRLRYRKKKMRKGSPNRRVLALWQEVWRMSRILKQEPPEQLLTLAEKAKYSQHTMTAEERLAFEVHISKLSSELNEKPWYVKLPVKLIFAVE